MKYVYLVATATSLFIMVSLVFIFIADDDDDIIMDAFLSQPNPTINHITPKIEVTVAMVEQQQEKEKAESNPLSVRLMEGGNTSEKVWNYIAQAGISGISDKPEVIAGILGNMEIESVWCPFIVNSIGMRGLYQTSYPALQDDFENAGISQHWHSAGSACYGNRCASFTSIPEADIDKAIQVTLDFLLTRHDKPNNPNGVGYSSFDFERYLDMPSVKTGEEGAVAYAELFAVTVERCVYGAHSVQDAGVIATHRKMYSSRPMDKYQNLNGRKDSARKYYKLYALGQTGL